jgi:RNA polymerase sigma factor (sigma-70 family)
MTAAPAVGEAEVAAALRRDPAEGLALLHAAFGVDVARYLKRLTWGLLAAEDLQDAYQETLAALWRHILQPGFDPEQPLRLTFTLARRKAIDLLRRRGHRARTNAEEVLSLLVQASSLSWRGRRLGRAEAAELRELLLEVVQNLPVRQRLVARVFIDHCDGWEPRDVYAPLTRAVAAVTGQEENEEAIKSCWRTARGRIATELRRHGYAWDDGSAP